MKIWKLCRFAMVTSTLVCAFFTSTASSAAPSGKIGMNKFDLSLQYVGRSSGGSGSDADMALQRRMALKSIQDASDRGLKIFRVAVTGYGPVAYNQSSDLDLWVQNKAAYWARMELMFADLNKAGVKLIPSFVWNMTQFPALVGQEKVVDLLTNQNSKSFLKLAEYLSEFIPRAKKAGVVEFYELTNELNLNADLDIVKMCKESTPDERCDPMSNITTDQIIVFSRNLAAEIRKWDTSKLISSGFALPRACAEHLRQRPGWSTQGPDWTLDSKSEFFKNIRDLHQSVEIVSVHLYNGEENNRFGKKGAEILDVVKEASDQIGKKVFVGEFNDFESGGSFFGALLDRMVSLRIPWSAGWVWQFYQESLIKVDPVGALEPGYSDSKLRDIMAANAKLGNPALSPKDIRPPIVITTSPRDGEKLAAQSKILLYAVASDDRSGVKSVEFYVDGKRVGEIFRPPFQIATILPAVTGSTNSQIPVMVKATDMTGKVSSDTIQVQLSP